MIKSTICRWCTESSVWTVRGRRCTGYFGICESSHGAAFPNAVICQLFCSQHPGVCYTHHVHSPPMSCIQMVQAQASKDLDLLPIKMWRKWTSDYISCELKLIVLYVLFWIFGEDDPLIKGMMFLSCLKSRWWLGENVLDSVRPENDMIKNEGWWSYWDRVGFLHGRLMMKYVDWLFHHQWKCRLLLHFRFETDIEILFAGHTKLTYFPITLFFIYTFSRSSIYTIFIIYCSIHLFSACLKNFFFC